VREKGRDTGDCSVLHWEQPVSLLQSPVLLKIREKVNPTVQTLVVLLFSVLSDYRRTFERYWILVIRKTWPSFIIMKLCVSSDRKTISLTPAFHPSVR